MAVCVFTESSMAFDKVYFRGLTDTSDQTSVHKPSLFVQQGAQKKYKVSSLEFFVMCL